MQHIKRGRSFLLVSGICFLLAGCVSRNDTAIIQSGNTAVPPRPPIAGFSGATGVSNRVVPSNSTTAVEGIFNVNVDCTPRSVTLRIAQPPVHGTAIVTNRDDFPNFPPQNPRSACNKSKFSGTFVDYTPQKGFTGSDFMVVEVFADNGVEVDDRLSITIK